MKDSDSVSRDGKRLEEPRPIRHLRCHRFIRSQWTFSRLAFVLLVFPVAFVILIRSKWPVFDGIDLGSVGENFGVHQLSKTPEQKARQLLKKYPLIGEKAFKLSYYDRT
jgi:hypothetical protein